MFKRIVVPLDGTQFAAAALAPAQELAHRFDASLLLVRAVRPANLPRLFSTTHVAGLQAGSQDGLEVVDAADSYLGTLTTRLREAGYGASYALFVAEPGTGIALVAELDRADLIAMAAHQRWTLDLTRSDSVTLQVLARSHIPILAWRSRGVSEVAGSGGDTADSGGLVPVATPLAGPDAPIVVPLDGSAVAESALPIAERLAGALDAELILVRAVPDGSSHLARTIAYLDGMRDALASRGVRAVAVAREGPPPLVIDAIRRECNAALIVMASHGSRGEMLGFLGSVAGAIIEETNASVLVVRP